MDFPKPQPPKKNDIIPIHVKQVQDKSKKNSELKAQVLKLKNDKRIKSSADISKELGVPESKVRAILQPRKNNSREKKTKKPFEKKDFIYDVTSSKGTVVKIYANDENEALKIYHGIHKDIPDKIEVHKKEFVRKEHLTNRPFKGLDKLLKEKN